MAISVDDILEFTLEGQFNGAVGTRNIFHYRVSNLDVGMSDTPFVALGGAARDFWAHIKDELNAMLSEVMRSKQVRARILTGSSAGVQNLYLIPTGEQPGLVGSNGMPPYVAHGYRYQGSGGAERNGYKRFAGVAESQNNAGVFDGSSTDANALATALSDEIQVSGGVGGVIGQFDMKPVIVKKMAGGLDPSDIVVIDFWEPVGVTYYGITTQNTRKFGRGI